MSGAYLVALIAVACGVVGLAVVVAVLLRAARTLARIKTAANTVFAHDAGMLRARKAALAVALRQRRDGRRGRRPDDAVERAQQRAVDADGADAVPDPHRSPA